MTFLKKLFVIALSVATVLVVVPFFAMLGLAAIGMTMVAGAIGSAVLAYKAKQMNQSKFAKAYAAQ